jgi:enolase
MEMSKSFAVEWIKGVHLFEYRLVHNLPEDNMFRFGHKTFRDDIDFHCFLISCRQLERAIRMGCEIWDDTKEKIKLKKILSTFKKETPYLNSLRNTYEHFDDYLMQKGRNKSIDTAGLRVYSVNYDIGKEYEKDWLGYKVNTKQVVKTADTLYHNFLEIFNKRKTKNAE